MWIDLVGDTHETNQWYMRQNDDTVDWDQDLRQHNEYISAIPSVGYLKNWKIHAMTYLSILELLFSVSI